MGCLDGSNDLSVIIISTREECDKITEGSFSLEKKNADK